MKSNGFFSNNKKYFTIIQFFLVIINISIIKSQNILQNYTCENISKLINENDKELISYIKKNMSLLKTNSHSCIDTFAKFMKIPVLDLYLNQLSLHGIQYKENLEISLNTILTQIDDVYNKHKYSEGQYQDVFPASRWAQSMDDVFIEIKFAHRHDSPGCLEIKNLKVELKEKSIKLIGYCILGDVPIKMNYNVKLWSKINVKASRHFESSVGRYQFNLKKKQSNTYWEKLLDEKMRIPQNMRIWFEMKEKYQEQISKYEIDENDDNIQNIVDTIEMEEKKKERKEKKKKKKKKKKIKTGENQEL